MDQKFQDEKKSYEFEIYQLKSLVNEKDNLLKAQSIKMQDFSQWREKLQQLEEQRQREIQQYKWDLERLNQLQQQSQANEDIETQAEKIAYETAIKQLRNTITDLNTELRNRIQELDELKLFHATKIQQLTSQLQENINGRDDEPLRRKIMELRE